MTGLRRAPLRAGGLALAAVLLVLTTLWATPGTAYACSCGTSSDNEHAAQAEAIFTGTITDDRVDERRQTRTLTFAVDQVFKGQVTATQVVVTAASGASCGLEISGAGPFVVFADQEQPGLTANLCGGTHAGAAPAGMGAGEAPLPDTAPDPQRGRWLPVVGLVLAALASGVVGLALVRRPRQPG